MTGVLLAHWLCFFVVPLGLSGTVGVIVGGLASSEWRRWAVGP